MGEKGKKFESRALLVVVLLSWLSRLCWNRLNAVEWGLLFKLASAILLQAWETVSLWETLPSYFVCRGIWFLPPQSFFPDLVAAWFGKAAAVLERVRGRFSILTEWEATSRMWFPSGVGPNRSGRIKSNESEAGNQAKHRPEHVRNDLLW